jgi:WD40 repeat protein
VIYDICSGRQLHCFEGHSAPINEIAVTADSGLLFSASDDQTVRMWNMITGRLIRTFKTSIGKILSLRITPEGRRLVSQTARAIELWEPFVSGDAPLARFVFDGRIESWILADDQTVVVADSLGRLHFLVFEGPVIQSV